MIRSKTKLLIIGFILMIVGIGFCLCETMYFGFNFLPKNGAEFCCDVISAVMFVCGARIIKVVVGEVKGEE